MLDGQRPIACVISKQGAADCCHRLHDQVIGLGVTTRDRDASYLGGIRKVVDEEVEEDGR